MPTLSVKLAEATKQRLQLLAQSKGATAHAVMVQAIESALDQHDAEHERVLFALRAREQVKASGTVVDGREFGDYLRNKVRGVPARRPKPMQLTRLASRS